MRCGVKKEFRRRRVYIVDFGLQNADGKRHRRGAKSAEKIHNIVGTLPYYQTFQAGFRRFQDASLLGFNINNPVTRNS